MLSVSLMPPAYKGSGLEQPFAKGNIVMYVVTAVPKAGEAISTEGPGQPQPDGTVRCKAGAPALRWAARAAA